MKTSNLPSASPLYASARFQSSSGGAWHPGGEELTRRGLALCGFPPGACILDAGCGSGAGLRVISSLGLRGTGLDRECRLSEPFPFVQADVQNPPFAENSFDGILCECVLSLLPEPEKALGRFASILRPGGKLLLSDLFVRGGSPVPGAAAGCAAGARTLREMEDMLAGAGFLLLAFEDHSAALRELAAKLLWYGDDTLHAQLRTGACSCSASRGGPGYGLWMATPAKYRAGEDIKPASGSSACMEHSPLPQP